MHSLSKNEAKNGESKRSNVVPKRDKISEGGGVQLRTFKSGAESREERVRQLEQQRAQCRLNLIKKILEDDKKALTRRVLANSTNKSVLTTTASPSNKSGKVLKQTTKKNRPQTAPSPSSFMKSTRSKLGPSLSSTGINKTMNLAKISHFTNSLKNHKDLELILEKERNIALERFNKTTQFGAVDVRRIYLMKKYSILWVKILIKRQIRFKMIDWHSNNDTLTFHAFKLQNKRYNFSVPVCKLLLLLGIPFEDNYKKDEDICLKSLCFKRLSEFNQDHFTQYAKSILHL